MDQEKAADESGKWLKSEETATEVAASVFDLRFDPDSSLPQRGKQVFVRPQGLERILACLAAASFHLPVGLVVGYSAILIPQLEQENSEIPVTKEDTGWIASLAVLIVPVGALLTGFLVDWMGRLNTIKVAIVPYIVGWVFIAIAKDLPMMFLGRFLTGFAIAMGPSPAIVYITEVARPDLRGSLICTGPSMTSLGMLLAYIKGSFLHWRTVAWLSIGYALIPVLLMYCFSPESPVWLLSKGKTDQALESLKFLSRMESVGGSAERQLTALQKETETKMSSQKTDSIIIRLVKGLGKPTGYKPFMILLMLFFFQQFSGIYITIFFAVTFFQGVGSSIDAYMSSIMIGLIRMLVGLMTSGLLKRYGRRPLCMISGLGMGVSLTVSGFYTKKIHSGEWEASWIPVFFILIYMMLSVIGLLSIPWTMTAELYPMEIRGLAQGLTVSLAHVIMFAALQVYRSLPNILGGAYAVQYLFAATSFASVIFVFIFLPETHKKMLSDIQTYFEKHTVYLLSTNKSKDDKGEEPV